MGKADALILMDGKQVFLIDTGSAESSHKLIGALNLLGIKKIDGVFLTHGDQDHVGGALPLAQAGIQVDAWYASAFSSKFSRSEHPGSIAAAMTGKEINWLSAGDEILTSEGKFSVLCPFGASDEENDNSLVILAETSQGTILFTGDMENREEAELLIKGQLSSADVLKVAHHGRDDTTSSSFLRTVRPDIALICADSEEDSRTPSSETVSRLIDSEAKVCVTQDAEFAVKITLSGGNAEAQYLSAPDFPQEKADVQIIQVETDDEKIVLKNHDSMPHNMAGWQLFSSKGKEIFVFPDVTIDAESSITVTTHSSSAEGDLVWKEKNVLKKKSDSITLYDSYGRTVSSWE